MTSGAFDELVPDVLGEPYLAETIHLPPDEEGPVVATLVVRRAPAPTRKAVLHVHGFCDYFFQTAYAEWWNDRGYDFYAVDLRKYGRSLRPHQTPNYVTDLREHFPDVDAALHRVAERDGHDHVVISAHSTGGLIVSLWANERHPAIAGMVLKTQHQPFTPIAPFRAVTAAAQFAHGAGFDQAVTQPRGAQRNRQQSQPCRRLAPQLRDHRRRPCAVALPPTCAGRWISAASGR